MAAFATAEELAALLGVEFSTEEAARADGLLEIASGLVADAAGLPLELVDGDELRIRGTREPSILLPGGPVVSVASVTLDGHELAAGSWYVDGDALVRCGGWGHSGVELVITYDHGFDEIPATVKGVVLEAVRRIWVNPSGVVAERLGQAQTTYAVNTPAGLLLTEDERRAVRRATRRSTGSVAIRG